MREVLRKHQKGLLMAIAMFILAFSSVVLADTTIDMGTLPNGKAVEKVGRMDKQGYIWFKFYAPKDGFLEVSGYEQYLSGSQFTSNIYFSLYNANKERIDAYSYGDNSVSLKNDRAVHYGIGKGVYYIRMKATDSNYYGYYIYAYFEGKGSTGGAKKAKALNMKKGKVYNVVIPAGKTRTVWFKFNANGKKKPKLIAYVKGQGQIEYKLFGKNLSKESRYFKTEAKNTAKIVLGLYRYGLLQKEIAPKKGTYYIKIKTYKNSNCWMKLKWKY